MTDSRPRPGPNRARLTTAGSGGGKTTELYTLGGVRVVSQGSDETSKLGPRHVALLVYLYHEARPLHPTELVDLLGRGQDDEKELDRLHKAINWLRNNVTGVDVSISGDTIETYGSVRLDTREVDAAIDGGDPRHVSELYNGEFLEGFESGAPAFDEWAQRERGRLQRAWSNAMLAAAREAERRRNWQTAGMWWSVLVSRAPMRGEAVAGLLQAYASGERWDDAAAAFRDYAARLTGAGVSRVAQPVAKVIAQHPTLKAMVKGGAPGGGTHAPAGAVLEEGPPVAADSSAALDEARSTPGAETTESLAAGATAEPEPTLETPEPADELAALPDIPDIELAEQEEAVAAESEPPPAAPQTPSSGARPTPQRPKASGVDAQTAPGTPRPRRSDSRVKHEVTSVRQPWTPAIKGALTELRPWWSAIGDALKTAVSGLVRGLLFLPALVGRAFATLSRAIHAGLSAVGERRRQGRRARAARRDARTAAAARKEVARERGEAGRKRKEAAAEREPVEREKKAAAPRTGEAAPEVAPRRSAVAARSTPASPRVAPLLTRYWYAPVAVGVAALAILFGPRLANRAGLTGNGSPDLPEVRAPVAGVPLPKVSVPQVTVRTPAFVETSVSKIGEMLSGPILGGPGRWLVVADVEVYPFDSAAAGGRSEDVQTVPLPEMPAEVTVDTGAAGAARASVGRLQPAGPGIEREAEADSIQALPTDVVMAADSARQERNDTTPASLDVPVAAGDEARDSAAATAEPQAAETIDSEPATTSAARQDSTPVSESEEDTTSAALTRSGAAPPDSTVTGALGRSEPPDRSYRRSRADAVLPEDPSLSPLSAALTFALEADLRQARYFHVVPRERALSAMAGAREAHPQRLPLDDALAVARSGGYAAVIAATVSRHAAAPDSVEIRVLNAAGDTLYGVAAEVADDMTTLETLSGLSRAVRRRLGEAASDVEASAPSTRLLTSSMPALLAYAEARAHLYANRYRQAIAASREATLRDTAFAMAYRNLAEAYALQGLRPRARAALERAWELSGRLSERERYRLLADRLAWDGRYSDAVLTYDELFKRYRDDAAALRSLALVQRTIGVRGGGEGNLRVAYSIDPYDWPSLSRLARFLGYSGPLPDVDALIAAAADSLQP